MQAIARLSARWPLGLASSSNRVVIDEVLTLAGVTNFFHVTVSSEEVGRGKPYPDVYEEACRRLHLEPRYCVAIEDSTNGIRSAAAAGLRVVAIPDRRDPPAGDALGRAVLVLTDLDGLTVEALEKLEVQEMEAADRRVDDEEDQSVPASDAHSDWAGPPERPQAPEPPEASADAHVLAEDSAGAGGETPVDDQGVAGDEGGVFGGEESGG
jgi:hypothetical protein